MPPSSNPAQALTPTPANTPNASRNKELVQRQSGRSPHPAPDVRSAAASAGPEPRAAPPQLIARPPPPPPTRLCIDWALGTCRLAGCIHAHPDSSAESRARVLAECEKKGTFELCRHHARRTGACWKKESCPFLHSAVGKTARSTRAASAKVLAAPRQGRPLASSAPPRPAVAWRDVVARQARTGPILTSVLNMLGTLRQKACDVRKPVPRCRTTEVAQEDQSTPGKLRF